MLAEVSAAQAPSMLPSVLRRAMLMVAYPPSLLLNERAGRPGELPLRPLSMRAFQEVRRVHARGRSRVLTTCAAVAGSALGCPPGYVRARAQVFTKFDEDADDGLNAAELAHLERECYDMPSTPEQVRAGGPLRRRVRALQPNSRAPRQTKATMAAMRGSLPDVAFSASGALTRQGFIALVGTNLARGFSDKAWLILLRNGFNFRLERAPAADEAGKAAAAPAEEAK